MVSVAAPGFGAPDITAALQARAAWAEESNIVLEAGSDHDDAAGEREEKADEVSSPRRSFVNRRISSLVTPAEVDASLETSPLALNQARKRFARGRLERACDVDADRCQQIEESPPTPLQRRIEPPLWRLQRLQNEADALRSWTDAHSSMRHPDELPEIRETRQLDEQTKEVAELLRQALASENPDPLSDPKAMWLPTSERSGVDDVRRLVAYNKAFNQAGVGYSVSSSGCQIGAWKVPGESETFNRLESRVARLRELLGNAVVRRPSNLPGVAKSGAQRNRGESDGERRSEGSRDRRETPSSARSDRSCRKDGSRDRRGSTTSETRSDPSRDRRESLGSARASNVGTPRRSGERRPSIRSTGGEVLPLPLSERRGPTKGSPRGGLDIPQLPGTGGQRQCSKGSTADSGARQEESLASTLVSLNQRLQTLQHISSDAASEKLLAKTRLLASTIDVAVGEANKIATLEAEDRGLEAERGETTGEGAVVTEIRRLYKEVGQLSNLASRVDDINRDLDAHQPTIQEFEDFAESLATTELRVKYARELLVSTAATAVQMRSSVESSRLQMERNVSMLQAKIEARAVQ